MGSGAWERDTPMGGLADRLVDRETDRKAGRETDRLTAERETDRQRNLTDILQ